MAAQAREEPRRAEDGRRRSVPITTPRAPAANASGIGQREVGRDDQRAHPRLQAGLPIARMYATPVPVASPTAAAEHQARRRAARPRRSPRRARPRSARAARPAPITPAPSTPSTHRRCSVPKRRRRPASSPAPAACANARLDGGQRGAGEQPPAVGELARRCRAGRPSSAGATRPTTSLSLCQLTSSDSTVTCRRAEKPTSAAAPHARAAAAAAAKARRAARPRARAASRLADAAPRARARAGPRRPPARRSPPRNASAPAAALARQHAEALEALRRGCPAPAASSASASAPPRMRNIASASARRRAGRSKRSTSTGRERRERQPAEHARAAA